MYEYDELAIYRGRDIPITKSITVTQPTIGEIEEFGEKRYFSAVHSLCGVGADFKWQLYDMGVDYTKVEDYDLFLTFISQLVSSKTRYRELLLTDESMADDLAKYTQEELDDMLINPLQLVLKDIDLDNFAIYKVNDTGEKILYDPQNDITIDRSVYARLVDIVRKIHGFTRNNQIPANEATKMDLIDDARDEYLVSRNMPFKSTLKPLVSSLVNHGGFSYGHNEIWDMKINAFFDSIKRLSKIQDATLLLQGAYSGFGSLKGVDKERLNWTGEI